MTKGKITMNAAKKFFLAGFLAVGLFLQAVATAMSVMKVNPNRAVQSR